MDSEQRQFLETRTTDVLHENPHLKPLLDKLLKLGGEYAVLPVIEEDLDAILSRGERFTPRWLRIWKGEPGLCHFNVGRLWDVNRQLVKICTGYALSDDGIWRQHSWGLFKKKSVVETTIARELYFGFILTNEEAEQFYIENSF